MNGCGRSDLYATHIPRYVRCWRRIREQCRDGRRSPWQRCARFTNVWLQRAQSATKPTKHIAINLACAGLLGHLITSCHRPYNKCSQSALEGQEGHYQGAESAPTQGIKASWRSFSSGTVFLLFPSIFDRCRRVRNVHQPSAPPLPYPSRTPVVFRVPLTRSLEMQFQQRWNCRAFRQGPASRAKAVPAAPVRRVSCEENHATPHGRTLQLREFGAAWDKA